MSRLADVKAERDQQQRRGDLYLTALQLVLREKPDAIETWAIDDCQYVWRAYGLLRADGGIVVQRFRCKRTGQADSFEAVYLEDLRWRQQQEPPSLTEADLAERRASERIRLKQIELCKPAIDRTVAAIEGRAAV